MRGQRTWLVLAVTVVVLAGACGSDDDDGAATATTTTATPATASTTSSAGGAVEGEATTTTSPAADPVQHGVGVHDDMFVDDSRPTPPSGDEPGTDTRVLESVVFYPTAGDPSAGAVVDAEPDRDHGPYPLIVFSHGLGGTPELSQPVIEAWVAAGFVVVAPRFPLSRPDHPGGPDAGDVRNQTGDVSHLIDVMTAATADPGSFYVGLVDPERVGASGHSNGAITTIGVTLHTCCHDDRIDAAVEFAGTASPYGDGEYDWSLAPPYLIVHGTADELVAYTNGVTLYNELSAPKGLLTLEGGSHSGMFFPEEPGFDEVVATTTDFWRAYLLDDAVALGRLGDGGHPDLRFAPEGAEPDVIPTTTVAGIDRHASADPVTDLVDGQVVTVTWSGFTPDGVVNVVQCAAAGEGASLCDLSAAQILVPDPTGEGSLELEIIVGAVGEGVCGPETDDCVIAVNDSGLTEPEATVYIPLQFAG